MWHVRFLETMSNRDMTGTPVDSMSIVKVRSESEARLVEHHLLVVGT